MPAQIIEIDVLQQYMHGIIARAAHHAGGVDEVLFPLAGAIVWRKDEQPIEVFTRQGEMKNVMWVRIGGKRYAFSYNDKSGRIEMRASGTRGELLYEFSNATSAASVRQIFANL